LLAVYAARILKITYSSHKADCDIAFHPGVQLNLSSASVSAGSQIQNSELRRFSYLCLEIEFDLDFQTAFIICNRLRGAVFDARCAANNLPTLRIRRVYDSSARGCLLPGLLLLLLLLRLLLLLNLGLLLTSLGPLEFVLLLLLELGLMLFLGLRLDFVRMIFLPMYGDSVSSCACGDESSRGPGLASTYRSPIVSVRERTGYFG
jgi:hypothetical protein